MASAAVVSDEPVVATAELGLEELERAAIAMARVDSAAFAEYVLRDEETGDRISLAPMHEDWHDIIAAHNRVIIWSHVEAGKSSQISTALPLMFLGQNPNLRIAVLSATQQTARDISKNVARYLDHSVELRAVFPDLKPDKAAGWNQTQIYVKRDSKVRAKDPSIRTAGVDTNVLGSRIDVLIIDDAITHDNAGTPEKREAMYRRIKANFFGRLTRNAKVIWVGNAMHPDDAMHRISKEPGWVSFKFPVIGHDGQPSWPQRWSMERIAQKRAEFGPYESQRQLDCVARDEIDARFKREWIQKALNRGNGRVPARSLDYVPAGYRVYTGVDLSTGETKRKGDLTALVTIVVHPDDSREVIDVEAGKWAGPEIIDHIIDVHRRYHGVVYVESNAAQKYILQFARGADAVPVRSFVTGKNKANPAFGIESIATELDNNKWIIPNSHGACTPEIAALVQELIQYNPANHTGDRLMAMWIAREASRIQKPRVGYRYLQTTAR